jgi:hypothetical protein
VLDVGLFARVDGHGAHAEGRDAERFVEGLLAARRDAGLGQVGQGDTGRGDNGGDGAAIAEIVMSKVSSACEHCSERWCAAAVDQSAERVGVDGLEPQRQFADLRALVHGHCLASAPR